PPGAPWHRLYFLPEPQWHGALRLGAPDAWRWFGLACLAGGAVVALRGPAALALLAATLALPLLPTPGVRLTSRFLPWRALGGRTEVSPEAPVSLTTAAPVPAAPSIEGALWSSRSGCLSGSRPRISATGSPGFSPSPSLGRALSSAFMRNRTVSSLMPSSIVWNMSYASRWYSMTGSFWAYARRLMPCLR